MSYIFGLLLLMGVHVFTTMANGDEDQIAENIEDYVDAENEEVDEDDDENVDEAEEGEEGDEDEEEEEDEEGNEEVKGEPDEGPRGPGEGCNCVPIRRPVCGNDGITYLNKCTYKCAADRNPNLRVKFLGACNEPRYIFNHHKHQRGFK